MDLSLAWTGNKADMDLSLVRTGNKADMDLSLVRTGNKADMDLSLVRTGNKADMDLSLVRTGNKADMDLSPVMKASTLVSTAAATGNKRPLLHHKTNISAQKKVLSNLCFYFQSSKQLHFVL